MKKSIKFKKDIQVGNFVIVNNEVVPFDKKYKVSDMKSDENGIIVFESKKDVDIYMQKDKVSDTQVTKDTSEKRKRNKSGVYNIPIKVEFVTGTQDESLAFAEEFMLLSKLKGESKKEESAVITTIFNKSKKSVLNKLKKFERKGLLNFANSKNNSNLIIVNSFK